MAGFGVIVVGVAAAYWLVLMAWRSNPQMPDIEKNRVS